MCPIHSGRLPPAAVGELLSLGRSHLNETLMVSDFYQHPDLYDALLPVGAHLSFYAELARQHPEGVLELACGTGQLAVPIAGLGVSIVGLDRSAAMLTTARRRAKAASQM